VLPQGTKQSPALFCEVSDAAARIFNRICARRGIPAFVWAYVDDFIMRARSHAALLALFEIMDRVGADLGLAWNLKKDTGRDSALTTIDALGIEMDSVAMELRLPQSKRESYLAAVLAFREQYKGHAACPRKPLEQLVGRLVFACRVCRWGFLFIQEINDQLFPVGHARPPKTTPLTEGLWHDLEFWAQALGPAFDTWLGIRPHLVGRRAVDVNRNFAREGTFQVELFTDASKTYGAGATLGPETLSQRWTRDVSEEHIGALELEALLVALRHWRHDLSGLTVLARLDNVQAVSAVNKGASRKPALRKTLLEMALLGLEFGFEVKAKHVKGKENPADAPSRGKEATSSQDYTFAFFDAFNSPPASVDCCAAVDGYNKMPGCSEWLSAARPVQANVASLVGKTLWANPPFAEAGPILDALVEAWRRDPTHTSATLVLPEWTTASWFRKYLRRKKPLFRVLRRYPEGSRVFLLRNSQRLAGPCPFPVLVARLGGPRT
jgi:hypothetical protein